MKISAYGKILVGFFTLSLTACTIVVSTPVVYKENPDEEDVIALPECHPVLNASRVEKAMNNADAVTACQDDIAFSVDWLNMCNYSCDEEDDFSVDPNSIGYMDDSYLDERQKYCTYNSVYDGNTYCTKDSISFYMDKVGSSLKDCNLEMFKDYEAIVQYKCDDGTTLTPSEYESRDSL